MATNPYELRWELFQNAESRLVNRYHAEADRWNSLTEKGEEAGRYPDYPSEEEIFALANQMKQFIEGN